MIKFVVGIDEAGRGPLAGPVSVGVVVVPVDWYEARVKKRHAKNVKKPALLKEAKDSKQLSPAAREAIFKKLQTAKKDGELDCAVTLVSAKIIDARGISFAIRRAMHTALKKIAVPPQHTLVLLDGSLYAPEHFLFQKTIIRGDQSEPVISLASIAAKVTRDRHMLTLARRFPAYNFDIHKGYGTLAHRQKIRTLGPCEIHRKSFLRGILGRP